MSIACIISFVISNFLLIFYYHFGDCILLPHILTIRVPNLHFLFKSSPHICELQIRDVLPECVPYEYLVVLLYPFV